MSVSGFELATSQKGVVCEKFKRKVMACDISEQVDIQHCKFPDGEERLYIPMKDSIMVIILDKKEFYWEEYCE